jgi:AcrR family transcriptional regulator
MMENQISTEIQILNAAEELFLNKGFAMTSTTEIAKKAGCNQALIHYYFRTKENLFIKLFESKFQEFVGKINFVKDEKDFKSKIKIIIESHIAMIEKNPKLPFLIFNELYTNPSRFGKMIENIKIVVIPVIMSLAGDLEKETKEGRIRPIDPFDLVFNVVSLNVFTFLAKPLLMNIKEFDENEYYLFIEERKTQIFDFVWNSIKI